LPLAGDRMIARVGMALRHRDSFVDRPLASKGLGDQDAGTFRASVDWKVNSELTIQMNLDGSSRREENAAQSLAGVNLQAPVLVLWNELLGPQFGQRFDDRWLTGDPLVSLGTYPTKNTSDIWGGSLHLNWDLGSLGLRSVTAYRDHKAEFQYDGDHSPLPIFDVGGRQKQHQLSHEFQLSGHAANGAVDWLTGVFLFRQKANSVTDLNFMSGLFNALEEHRPDDAANVMLDLDIATDSNLTTESLAGFGHLIWSVDDIFKVNGGLRYSYERKKYDTDQFRKNAGVFAVPPSTDSAS